MDTLLYKKITSPVGELTLVANNHALVAILWDCEKPTRVRLGAMDEASDNPFLLQVARELEEYFDGTRSSFTLPLELNGTPFQKAVWQALGHIPHGKTCSYKEIAEKVERPQAVRAVGAAIGRNPISIILPCHRVVASDGNLTGFAGGLERKKTLLSLETHPSD